MKVFDAVVQALSEHRVYANFTERRWMCPACPKWRGMNQEGADIHIADIVDQLTD